MKFLTFLFIFLPALLPIHAKQKSWVQTWKDEKTKGRGIFGIEGEWMENIGRRLGFKEFARARGNRLGFAKNWDWRENRRFTMTLEFGRINGDPHLVLSGDPGPLAEIPKDHTPPYYKFIIRPDDYKLPNKFYLKSAMDQDEPGGYTGLSKLTTPCSGCLQLDIVVKTKLEDIDLKIKIVYNPKKKWLVFKTTDFSNRRRGRVLTQRLWRKKNILIPKEFCRKINPPWHPRIEMACKVRPQLKEKDLKKMDQNCRPTHLCLQDPDLGIHHNRCRKSCDLCGDQDCHEF